MALGVPKIRIGRGVPTRDLGQGNNHKVMKLLLIILLLPAAVACGRGQQGARAPQLEELRAENDRLEAELTELREQKLTAERGVCSEQEVVAPAPEPKVVQGEELPDLPVIKLEPGNVSEEEGPVVSLRPAADPDDADIPSDVRPVLKVRGQHEAWVYHRRVETSESSVGPAPTPIPSSD